MELFCGVTPLIETTWAEFDSPLMRECLPHMLNSLGYSTAFFSPVHIGTAQPRSGFTHLFGKDQVVDFWKRVCKSCSTCDCQFHVVSRVSICRWANSAR